MVASADLEQSLRGEIDGYVNVRLESLREDVERLQSQVNEALTRLIERMQNETRSDASVAVSIAEHLRAARNTGIETAAAETARARASSDLAILKAAVDDIDSQRTQADVLGTLVNRAASFAPRVAFFIVKNGRATGWRARGLEGTVGDDRIREISLPLTSDTLLGVVAGSRHTWSGAPGTHADDAKIYNHFGDESPQRIVAIPLVAREKTVAILYADSSEQDSDAIGLEALETLARVAGMAVELLAARRPAAPASPMKSVSPVYAGTVTAAPSTMPAAPTPPPITQRPEVVPSIATPYAHAESMPQAETWAPPPAPHTPLATTAAAPLPVTAPPIVERPTPPVAPQAPAPVPAPSPATAVVPPAPSMATAGTSAMPARRAGNIELPIEVSEAERPKHVAALRYARLLVSEIKLYNEQKVKEGRAAGDLYSRLREDVDKARGAYDNDKRAKEVAERYDYFHHELVNQIAEGDAAKLGDNYSHSSAE